MVEPVASTTASYRCLSWGPVTDVPTSTLQRKLVPSSFICRIRRSRTAFSILNSGMPNRSRPPGSSARSNTATV